MREIHLDNRRSWRRVDGPEKDVGAVVVTDGIEEAMLGEGEVQAHPLVAGTGTSRAGA